MKTLLTTLGFFLLYISSFAQTSLGLLSSNYCGISTVKFNPAIADNVYKFDLNLAGCYLTGSNNAGGIPFNDFFNNNFNRQFFAADVRNNSLFSSNLLLPVKNRSSYFFYKSTEIQGPGSFMLNFGKVKQHAIAVSYNYNVVKNFTTNDSRVIELAMPNAALPASFISKSFSAKALSWVDVGVTYSGVMVRKPNHMFKGGITLKYIMGTGYVNSSSDNLDFSNNINSGTVSGTLLHNQSSNFLVDNGTTNFGTVDLTSGFATDFGFVYEWRPKIKDYYYEMDSSKENLTPDADVYTLRFAFSATDLGFVSAGSQTIVASPVSETYSRNDLNEVLQGLSVPASYSPSFGEQKASFILPMRFNLSVDYNIYKGLGLNFMGRIAPNLKNKDNYVRHASEIVFTPRYDHKWAGVYLPFSYDFNSNISLGIAARLGPVFIGFDNLLMFASKGVFRAGGYVGVKVPLHHRKPKDKDNDKVSDVFDKCIGIVGTWTAKGCIDKDGDGVADFEDKCPDYAGLAINAGCPDTDGDGVADADDKCPDNSGPVELGGCPDTDGDGVIDKEDSCIDVAGSKQYFGCLDTDGDGVADNLDKCPKVKGSVAHQGCNDTDKDGVFDDIDPCENEPGPVENEGCPWEDSDGDGIFDNEDSCVLEAGSAKYHGCNKPVVPKNTQFEVCRDTLLFDIGSRALNLLNIGKLDIMIKELNNSQSYNVKIIGYTDEWETDKSNYEFLSRQRALAVMQYFIDNGIAQNRLTYDGFGNENPVGDNKAWSGRRTEG